MAESETKKRKIEEVASDDLINFKTAALTEKAKLALNGLTDDQVKEVFSNACQHLPGTLTYLKEACLYEITTRKIFVRGLTWDITNELLTSYFSHYGTVVDATIVQDKTTGQSKGYGFVTFRDVDTTHAALREPMKYLGSIQIHCNLAATNSKRIVPGAPGALPGPTGYAPAPGSTAVAGGSTSNSSDTSNRKLFVRGLPYDITPEVLRQPFERFGTIEDVHIAMDRTTGKSRGFGFVTFAQDSAAAAALVNPTYTIEGRTATATLAAAGSTKRQGPPQSAPAASYDPYGYNAATNYGASASYGAGAGGYYGGSGGYGAPAGGYYGAGAGGYSNPSAGSYYGYQ